MHHVCNLFTAAATLCLDADSKHSTEVAATLLFSLLDILHGMLTYMSGVVRLALQVSGSLGHGSLFLLSSLTVSLFLLKECTILCLRATKESGVTSVGDGDRGC